MCRNTLKFLYYLIPFLAFSSAYFKVEHFFNIDNYRALEFYNRWHMCWGDAKEGKGECCSCEPNCMRTKTCCINAFWNSTYESRQDVYIKDFLSLSLQFKDQDCLPVLPKYVLEGTLYSYYMVTSCPENSRIVSKELKDKCRMGRINGSSIDHYIPVKGDDDYLYRNKYCAMCNSVSEFEMVEIEKGCKSQSTSCYYQLSNPKKTFTRCRYNYKITNKNCLPNNTCYNLCRSFVGPMGNYANYFCYLCNHGYTSNSIFPDECQGEDTEPGLSWASLLKFDFTDKADSQCKSGTILDGANQKCTSFVCPDGYQAKNSKCIATKVGTNKGLNIKEASFDKCLLARNPNILIKDAHDYHELLKELLPDQENDTRKELVSKLDKRDFIDGNSIKNFSIKIAELKKEEIQIMLHKNGSILFTPASFYSLANNRLNSSRIFLKNMICAYPISVDIKSLNFTQTCDAIVNETFIPLNNLSMHIIINKNVFKRKAYTCNQFHLSKPCPRKILDRNHTFKNDTRLYYKKDGATRMFELYEYAPYKDGGYTVCIDKGKDVHEPAWLSIVDKVSAYISVVGSSLSVFCYLLLIITVSQFTELRNVPGLCTLALSINLLIGDGLFLTTNFMHMSGKYKNMISLCDAIGILIHFFLLSAQMWGLVMAIDISVNLTKMTFSNQNSKRKFILYNVIPILFSVILVMIALLFRANDIIDVSYNKGGMCVLHGFYSRIFLYFLPLLCCFFVSVVSLTISLSYIAKERRKSKNVLEGSTKNSTSMIKVGLKLVILCGITEGIGIIYIPTKQDSPEGIFIVNSIFMTLYSLVKGFRGVMLFIVYICRKQVYEMYRKQYGRKDMKHNDSTFNSTATTRI